MRTLRFTLAGTVILALLGGVGGAVLAQEESPGASPAAMAPVLFTGGATCGFGPAEEWLADDPRVTGPCSMTIEQEGGDLPGGFVAVGDYTVNGPEGDWVGTWSVMAFPPTLGRNFMVLEGTEAYEGWAVWAWATAPDGWEGEPFDLVGVIYEGSAPRLEWSELPAE